MIDVSKGLGELLSQPGLQQYFIPNFCTLGDRTQTQTQLFLERLSRCGVLTSSGLNETTELFPHSLIVCTLFLLSVMLMR